MTLHIRVLGLLALIAGSLLAARPAPARADGLTMEDLPAVCYGVTPTEPNRWLAVWHFNGSAQGCVIYTGEKPAPDLLPTITGYALIDCATVGNVSYKDGNAIFGGQSYLSCPLAPNPNAAPDAYADYATFWIYASASLDAGYRLNPIFHHEDASMAVRTLRTPSTVSTPRAQLEWSLSQSDNTTHSATSTPFALKSTNDLMIMASCPLEQEDMCPNEASFMHTPYINGAPEPGYTMSTSVRFGTNQSTIYIGHTPGTSDYLRGKLGILIVDPQTINDPT